MKQVLQVQVANVYMDVTEDLSKARLRITTLPFDPSREVMDTLKWPKGTYRCTRKLYVSLSFED